MQGATQTLRHEHEAIQRMLTVAEHIAAQLESGTAVPRTRLDETLEFFQMFADRCHHGKEEDLLFPLLELKGLPRDGGPVAVMLHEHESGRAAIRAMSEAGAAYPSDPMAGLRWAAATRQYSGLLKAHIQKENNVLFVIAERLLSQEEQLQLGRDFEKLETEKMGAGTHDRLHKMMDRLLAEVSASSS